MRKSILSLFVAASADPTIPGVDWLPTMISAEEYKNLHASIEAGAED